MMGQIARAAVVSTILAYAALCAGAEQAPSTDQEMLVLRNGEILVGRITHKAKTYVVDLPNGRIRLKEADVDLVCRSLEDGYKRKRRAIQIGNIHDHLKLAQWCLRHDLWGPAAAELADATTAAPKHPMIGVLRRRLEMAMEPPLLSPPQKTPARGPSNNDLDQMVRSMPSGVVEEFTQSVQPVLMNQCASCHGQNSETGMRLLRGPAGKPPSRRFTQRNLYSVLQYIDRENPLASRFLIAPNGPHGTAQHAIFSMRQASQFQRMIVWTNRVAQRPSTPVAPSFSTPEPAMLSRGSQKVRPLPTGERNQTVRRAGPHAPAKADGEVVPASFNEPVAPFDPKILNRRSSPEKKSAPAT